MFARPSISRPSTTAAERVIRCLLSPTSSTPRYRFSRASRPSLTRLTYSSRAMATFNGAPALEQSAIEKEAQHQANGDVSVNNWSQPGPAAFDFRSEHRQHQASEGNG